MICRGICDKYRPVRWDHREKRYLSGQKRCQICELFIVWVGIFCPCCKARLRSRPRNLPHRENFHISQRNKKRECYDLKPVAKVLKKVY